MSYELGYTKGEWINVGIDNLIIAADTDAGEAIADCDISYLIKKKRKDCQRIHHCRRSENVRVAEKGY